METVSISLAAYNDLKRKEAKLKLFEYVYDNHYGSAVTFLQCNEPDCEAMAMEVSDLEGPSMYINCKTMTKCRASLYLAGRSFECLDQEVYCERHVHRLTEIDHEEKVYACQWCLVSIKERYCDDHIEHATSRYDDIYDTCEKCFKKLIK